MNNFRSIFKERLKVRFSKAISNKKVREFSQSDINQNHISYKIDMRKANDIVRAHDTFTFTLEDGWGNASKDNFEFIVTWSSISFESSRVEVCEENQV